jgi:TRAP-type mannitol/chloroaromatic compound transport system substrate-binding protein
MKRRTLFTAVVLILVATLAAGCGGNTASQSGGGDNNAAAPDKVITWKVATTWPDSIMIHQNPVQFAEIINQASGGRMKVEVYSSGALVGAAEVLDAANTKTVDAYHTFSGYWIGKMPAAPFFSSVPMTMEPFMHLVWTYEGGGLELWQKMYDEAGYNIKVLPLGISHPETLAWANKPIQQLEDWNGLKYRTVGWWGEILRENGVSVTSLPAGELYPSLERGILDATEFSTPINDKVLGFHEVTKYMTGPGMHQPSVLFYIGINKDRWNELSPDLQALVESTARSVTLWSWCKDFADSAEAVKYFKSEGVEQLTVDEDVQRKLKADTDRLLDQKAQEEGGIFAEIWTSMKEFRKDYIEYENFIMPIRAE